MKFLQTIPIFIFILIATILEVSGDALVRKCIYNYTGTMRVIYFVIGGLLLLGYGTFLNLAPIEFSKVVGLYIATLFVVWQVINFIAFKSLPTLPVIVGGVLIIRGGLIITYWQGK